MRITWLLLSLCFLFHSVCSENTTTVGTTTTMSVLSGGTSPVTDTQPTTPNVTTNKPQTTAAVTSKTTMVNTPTTTTHLITATATVGNKPTASSAPPATTHQPTTLNTTSESPRTTSGTTPNVVTVSPTKTPTPAVVGPVVTFKATDAPPTSPPVATKVSGTSMQPPNNTGTPSITKSPTNASAAGEQSTTHTTITSKTTTEVTGKKDEPSRASEPTGGPGTTITSPTMTKETFLANDTLNTKAGTTTLQTTTILIASTLSATPTTTTTTTTTTEFKYSLNSRHEKDEEKDLVVVCKRLMAGMQDGNCTLIWTPYHNGTVKFDSVEIRGKVKTSLANQYYEEITKKAADNKTLIAILASCGALLIMIAILAICASRHRKPYGETQQHLTEELHTVENGYHDNPTLEVMEVQPEMQEKKVALKGEFNDSWIVPIDNLLKEDMPDEEDTHL